MLVPKRAKSLFQKKQADISYVPVVKDGNTASRNRFFAKKQKKHSKITSDNYPEEYSTVAFSLTSGSPPPPRRHHDDPIDLNIVTSLMSSTLNSSFGEEDSDIEQGPLSTSSCELGKREPNSIFLKKVSNGQSIPPRTAIPSSAKDFELRNMSTNLSSAKDFEFRKKTPELQTKTVKAPSTTRIIQNRESAPSNSDTREGWCEEADPWTSFLQDRADFVNWNSQKQAMDRNSAEAVSLKSKSTDLNSAKDFGLTRNKTTELQTSATKAPPITKRIQNGESVRTGLDSCDCGWEEEDLWTSFVQDREDVISWNGQKQAIDWKCDASEESGDLPPLSTLHSRDFSPRDTSDEASLDPSTVSTQVMILSSEIEGEHEIVFISDPECPLQFLPNADDSDDDEIEDPVGDFWRPDSKQNASPRTVMGIFDNKGTGKSRTKKQSGMNANDLAKKLHNDTVLLIGSMSEKLVKFDTQARATFQSVTWKQQATEEDNNSIVSSGSEKTIKKTNLSLCASFEDDLDDAPTGFGCRFFDPFFRGGQEEI
eukprot:scaffold10339_cov101-Cylindrotheca_fusiformis.AAC.4